jgi:hypothetical protein
MQQGVRLRRITMPDINLTNVKTCDLVQELAKRIGVEEFSVAPNISFSIKVDAVNKVEDTGPARILYVYD